MSERNSTEQNPAISLPPLSGALKGNAANVGGVALCYILGLIIGYGWPDMVSPAFISNLEQVNEAIMKEYAGRPAAFALSSFSRDFIAIYIAMVMGALACVPPVYFMLSEGILTGAIAAGKGASLWALLAPDAPSLLELLAGCLAMGWGVKIGFAVFKPPRLPRLRMALAEAHRIFISIILPLLLAANAVRMTQMLIERG